MQISSLEKRIRISFSSFVDSDYINKFCELFCIDEVHLFAFSQAREGTRGFVIFRRLISSAHLQKDILLELKN